MGYTVRQALESLVRYAGQPHGKEPGAKPWTMRERFPNVPGIRYETDMQSRVVGISFHYNPLAHLTLTKSGKRKLWLLNGDRFESSWGHNPNDFVTNLRSIVESTEKNWFIIPFSACREAGIDLETITPVHVEDQSYTYTEHTARRLDDVPQSYRTRHAYLTADNDEIIAPHAPNGQEAHPDHEGGWYIGQRGLNGWENVPVEGPGYPTGYLRSTYVDIVPEDDGLYHYTVQRHWLGGSLFKARYSYDVPKTFGRRKRWAYFVTSFDYNEPSPLWFMSELPRGSKPTTVAEAIDMLKPDVVREAETRGVSVLRQGDVFVIQVPGSVTTERSLTNQGGVRREAPWRSHYPFINDSHTATRVIEMQDGTLYVRGMMRHRPRNRRPDHRNVKLWDGETWGRVAFNTVPRQINYNGQDTGSRSWSRGGDVD